MYCVINISNNLVYSYQSHQRNLRQSERIQEAAAEEADEISIENVQEHANDAANDGENEQRTETPSVPNTDATLLSSGVEEQDENHRLPAITLLRTYILSFFSSLIPETPAV